MRKIRNLIEFTVLVFSVMVGCGAVVFLIAMALIEMRFGYVTISEHNQSAIYVNLAVLIPSLPLLAFFAYRSVKEVKK